MPVRQLVSGSRPEREFTKDNMSLKTYLQTAFRWQAGRQKSGYDKMLLITGRWPILFDSYLIRYPVGSEILTHTDPVLDKQHYRLNIIIKKSKIGGDFICSNPIYSSDRVKLFRPDVSEHTVTRVTEGSRYVLSFGWAI